MSVFSEFSNEVVHTMQIEHDLVMGLSKKLRLLEARVEQLEQKQ